MSGDYLLPLAKRLYDDDWWTYVSGSAGRPEWEDLRDSRKGKYLDRAEAYAKLVTGEEK